MVAAAYASAPHAACPGWVVLVLIAVIAGGVAWLALTASGRAFDDFERREQYRRDGQ